MIFKLSYKNVKKSFGEYSVYIITLTIAVAINYIFNLLPFQPFMNEFSQGASENIVFLLSNLSTPLTLIVGALILYSNNFLLKRRSREIGIYLMLGTRYSHIHLIMILENFIISGLSFVCGCFLGMGLSRIAVLFIIKLLGLNTQGASILFNYSAMFKTLMTLGLIFIFVSIFNYFIISRANLLDIVKSNGKSAAIRKKKPNLMLNCVLFAVSIGLILFFYQSLMQKNVEYKGTAFFIVSALGLLGHMFLFISASAVAAALVEKNKTLRYKGINSFTIKQITTKIQKNGVILGIISYIMSLTLVMLNLGFSSHIWIDDNLKYTAPYSISISGIQKNVPISEISKLVENEGYKINDSHSFNVYSSEYKINDFWDSSKISILPIENQYSGNINVNVIKLSDYNKLRDILGFEKILLDENSYTIHLSNQILPVAVMKEKDTIKVNGKDYKLAKNYLYNVPLNDERGLIGGEVTIVVPNNALTDKLSHTTSFVIDTDEIRLDGLSMRLYDKIADYNGGHAVIVRSERRDYNIQLASVIIFAGLFIGFVLLIAGASVLSLQHLTDVMENKKGYEIISKLGVSHSRINYSIFKQLVFYFLLPLVIAIVHSIIISSAMVDYILINISNSIFIKSIIVSSLAFFAVYICYILFTYSKCKKIYQE